MAFCLPSHSDAGSGHRDQGAGPLFVSECRGTFESDLGASLELCKIKCGTGWDSDVAQDDCTARSLTLDGGSSGGESARTRTLNELRCTTESAHVLSVEPEVAMQIPISAFQRSSEDEDGGLIQTSVAGAAGAAFAREAVVAKRLRMDLI